MVIGPGMGRSAAVAAVTLRAAQQGHCPVVVDADGLNALADVPDLSREVRGRIIMTPHPGEFSRLADGLGITSSGTYNAARRAGAESLAQRLGVIVVLKGAGTVVTDGQRTWACQHSVPTLAVPGSGDVLAGVIAGLIAQYTQPPNAMSLWDVACAAVEAHALAGNTWAQHQHATGGMLATDLCKHIPRSIEELRIITD
jgi:NAD(P)H-hydrate epimerase